MSNNPVLPSGMKSSTDAQRERQAVRLLNEIGDCPSLQRFIGRYAKPGSREAALFHLDRYLKWLRSAKGVTLNPDQLIEDNLRCVYESGPVDVARKRKHTDWLDEFVNRVLLQRGVADSSRMMAASFVKQFYERNDSPLFGSFSVSSQRVKPPPPPLSPDDIRIVLRDLPLAQRVPLLFVWQSGCEISRVMSLTWKDVQGDYPLKLQFYGRKKHKRPYHTYLGRDSIEALKVWREKWIDLQGREPTPDDLVFMGKKKAPMDWRNLNDRLKDTALKLAKAGAVRNGDRESWHSHFLRHSFKSECSHAGVRSEVSEFWMGHDGGIKFVYDHSSELHEEDMINEYLKVEPFISLNAQETALRKDFEKERQTWLKELIELKRQIAELAASRSQVSRSSPG